MLTRIITALILAPVVILVTLYAPTKWFGLALLGVVLLGLHEWSQLTIKSPLWFFIMTTFVIAATWWFALIPQALILASILAAVFWLFQLYDLSHRGLSIRHQPLADFIIGAVVLFGAWCALVLLHQKFDHGPQTTVAVMAIVWAADSCAYFSGKFFGRNKLAPELSPNKTIEGLVGGMLGACLVAVLFALLVLQLSITDITLWLWLFAAAVAALISVVGDLYQSRLKRFAGVKDSGSLLPGHGGVLDRVDGLVAAVPVFASIWYWVA